MSNFKVNSKSTILEFKRKHNKLVDKTGNIPNVENAQSGTIASGGVLGLNSQGKVVKGSISGGTQLYKHTINCESPNGDGRILEIVSLSSSPISVNVQNVYSLLINSILFSLFNTEEEPMELIITNNNVSSIDILISEGMFLNESMSKPVSLCFSAKSS